MAFLSKTVSVELLRSRALNTCASMSRVFSREPRVRRLSHDKAQSSSSLKTLPSLTLSLSPTLFSPPLSLFALPERLSHSFFLSSLEVPAVLSKVCVAISKKTPHAVKKMARERVGGAVYLSIRLDPDFHTNTEPHSARSVRSSVVTWTLSDTHALLAHVRLSSS